MKFSAVILTGGPIRPEKTITALHSLNKQFHVEVEKILVSNGRSDSEISEFYAAGALNADWKVIRFPVNTYIRRDEGSVWRFPGMASLAVATGDFIFFQSDDDFLAPDFFSRMNSLFLLYPEGLTAIGLPVSWIYQTGLASMPPSGAWEGRPIIEPGRDLLRKHFKDSTYTYNPGFSFVCRMELIRKAADTVFESGAPDFTTMIQIATQGPTLFDRHAHMYWGRHPEQDHFEWDRHNIWTGHYAETYNKMALFSNRALEKFLPNSRCEQRMVKNYCKRHVAESSARALLYYLKFQLQLISKVYKMQNGDKKKEFSFMRHLLNICRAPGYSAVISLKSLLEFLKSRIAQNHK